MQHMALFSDNTGSEINGEKVKLETTIINDKEVKYDPREFEVIEDDEVKYLHYIGNGKNLRNPEGNISCYRMFSYYEGQTLDLSNFDTSNVTDMNHMFTACKFTVKFTLGDKFDTSNVTDMSGMFYECIFPEGFSLSDKFDTSNVTDIGHMFRNCSKNFKIPDWYRNR